MTSRESITKQMETAGAKLERSLGDCYSRFVFSDETRGRKNLRLFRPFNGKWKAEIGAILKDKPAKAILRRAYKPEHAFDELADIAAEYYAGAMIRVFGFRGPRGPEVLLPPGLDGQFLLDEAREHIRRTIEPSLGIELARREQEQCGQRERGRPRQRETAQRVIALKKKKSWAALTIILNQETATQRSVNAYRSLARSYQSA